jgi:hypothetical protein
VSTRTTEFAAQITGDASGAIKALEEVKQRVQQTAQSAETANARTAKSFELTVDKARKAAAGVTGVSQALFALQSEGSAKVLALGAAVGNFAELFGPAGALVTGVGVAGSAIVALFLKAREEAERTTVSIQNNIRSLARSKDLAGLSKLQADLFSGDENFPEAQKNADPRERRRARGISSGGLLGIEPQIDAARAKLAQLEEAFRRLNKANASAAAVSAPGSLGVSLGSDELQKARNELNELIATQRELRKEYEEVTRQVEKLTPTFLSQTQTTIDQATATERAAAAKRALAAATKDAAKDADAEGEKAKRAAAENAAAAKTVAASIASLTLDLADLQAEASGSALRTLDAVYARITAELEKKAAASAEAADQAERLGETENAEKLRALTAGFREQVQVAEKRRDGLKEITRLSERAAAAAQTEALFTKAANASYAESVPTIADVKRAENELLSVRTALQAIADDPKTDPAVRAEAQRQLAALVKNEAEATAALAANTTTAANAAQSLGAGIQSSAQAALSLVQLLGDGNTELAQMLSSVVSIGSGISGLGSAASAAGGFGALFSSAGGIASALGPIGAIAGGVVSLVGVLGQQSEAAKRRAEELDRAANQFQERLAQFVRDISEQDIGSFAAARNALAEKFGDLLADAVKAVGLDDSKLRGGRQNADGLRAYLALLDKEITRLSFSGGEAYASMLNLAAAVRILIGRAEDAEEALRREQAAQIKTATDDLKVRRLVAQGRSEEAEVERERLAAQRELEQAMNDFDGAEGYQEYIRALKAVQAAEAAAAAATRARTRAINELNDTNDILGGTAGEKLARALGTFGGLFSQLDDIAKGLDLNTEAGLTALRAKLRAEFNKLLEGGISDAEQPIVEAIRAILGNIDAALGALADPLQQAAEAFGEMINTFGLSLLEQVTGWAETYAEQFPDIAALFGKGFDPAAVRANIGAQITEILKDGKITEEERPLLQALQLFFGLLGQIIDEAAQDAEENAAEAETARQRRRSLATGEANLDIALNDSTGADAFFTTLGSFSKSFREALGTIDVSSADGIASATTNIKKFYQSIEGLTDEELVERFGMNRDEIIAALTQIDGGLDGLGEALATLASEQEDFLTQINLAYFDAFGQGLDAVRLQTEIWVEQMIATATALNLLTPDLERRIRAIGARRIDNAAAQAAEREARPTGTAAATSTATATKRSNTNVVGDFGGLSEITGQSLAGLLREIAINTGAQGALVDAILGRGAPASLASLRFPTFPTAGAGGAGTIVNIGPITVHVGGISADGATPAAAGSMVAREIAAQLGRLATQEIRFLGSGVA